MSDQDLLFIGGLFVVFLIVLAVFLSIGEEEINNVDKQRP